LTDFMSTHWVLRARSGCGKSCQCRLFKHILVNRRRRPSFWSDGLSYGNDWQLHSLAWGKGLNFGRRNRRTSREVGSSCQHSRPCFGEQPDALTEGGERNQPGPSAGPSGSDKEFSTDGTVGQPAAVERVLKQPHEPGTSVSRKTATISAELQNIQGS
jgi:hypothetical protein